MTIGFKSCYCVCAVAPTSVFLIGERGNALLQGALYFALAPLLKEARFSLEQIIEKIETEFSLAEIYYAFELLEKGGFIERQETPLPLEIRAYCNFLGVEPELASRRLKKTKVFLKGCPSLFLEPYGVEIVSESSKADFTIVAVQDYLDPALHSFNQFAYEKRHPWLLIKPYGSMIWVGPFFDGENSPCWECLAFRLKKNRLEQSYIERTNKIALSPVSRAFLPSTSDLAYSLVAHLLFKRIVQGEKKELSEEILTFDTLYFESQKHRVIPHPHCPICGIKALEEFKPIELQSSEKKKRKGGSQSMTPEETFQKYAHLISPITGIVPQIDSFEEQNESVVHVYLAGHNFALSNEVTGIFPKSLRKSSAGKGETQAQAKASCLCEAIERYSGVFRGDEKRRRGSYRALKQEAIHLDKLLCFSKFQYENRALFNKKAMSHSQIPFPFDEEAEIEWSPAWSLTHQRRVYLPTEFCYYGYPQMRFCFADSNGCAAGNSMEEAILQGFCELIERDAVSLWWYNYLRKPSVDLASFEEPYFEKLVEEYRLKNREVWVLDLTTDLSIPSFAAISRKLEEKEKIYFGFGSHLNAKRGITRALSEMNQCSAFFAPIENATERPLNENDPDSVDFKNAYEWITHCTIDNQPYLKPSGKIKKASDYLLLETDDLKEDIHYCESLIKSHGMEMIVLDLTRPDIALNVVKVVVPTLRHFWPRFGSGRLYDVPLKLGWLEKSFQESELNRAMIL